MKHVILSLVFALGLTACASVPVKQKATLGLQAAHTAVAAAQDTERSLYAAKVVGLTPQVHGQLAGFFEGYFTAEQKATVVLLAWKAGDPVPADLQTALADLTSALNVATAITEDAPRTSVLGKINAGIAEVRKVLSALGGIS